MVTLWISSRRRRLREMRNVWKTTIATCLSSKWNRCLQRDSPSPHSSQCSIVSSMDELLQNCHLFRSHSSRDSVIGISPAPITPNVPSSSSTFSARCLFVKIFKKCSDLHPVEQLANKEVAYSDNNRDKGSNS